MYAVLLIQCTDRLGAGDLGTLCMYKPDRYRPIHGPQGSLDHRAALIGLSNNPVGLVPLVRSNGASSPLSWTVFAAYVFEHIAVSEVARQI